MRFVCKSCGVYSLIALCRFATIDFHERKRFVASVAFIQMERSLWAFVKLNESQFKELEAENFMLTMRYDLMMYTGYLHFFLHNEVILIYNCTWILISLFCSLVISLTFLMEELSTFYSMKLKILWKYFSISFYLTKKEGFY